MGAMNQLIVFCSLAFVSRVVPSDPGYFLVWNYYPGNSSRMGDRGLKRLQCDFLDLVRSKAVRCHIIK